MNEGNAVAVVGGVGPGLGASLCRALGAAGYRVAGLARGTTFGERLAAELGKERYRPVACDLTDAAAVDAAFGRIERELGAPTVYIHNAGRLLRAPFLELDPDEVEAVWRLSCLGAMLCARRVLPSMVARKQGVILFTGATAALRGGTRFAGFAAAKFAARGLAQSLAREFGPQGIHVAHIVIDGIIWSERARELHGVTEEQCLHADAIAQAYLHLIHQDPSAWTQELDLRPAGEKF